MTLTDFTSSSPCTSKNTDPTSTYSVLVTCAHSSCTITPSTASTFRALIDMHLSPRQWLVVNSPETFSLKNPRNLNTAQSLNTFKVWKLLKSENFQSQIAFKLPQSGNLQKLETLNSSKSDSFQTFTIWKPAESRNSSLRKTHKVANCLNNCLYNFFDV